MANEFTNTSSVETNGFIKGMVKDPFSSFEPKENWTHAINAANNSIDGDVGVIGNEPANLSCSSIPYTVIGTVHRYADKWILFSTDDINSEIGLFDDSQCQYTTLINDPCLNFNKKYLVTGAAKENFDFSWQVYWDDGNNPSRTLNIDSIPYKQICKDEAGVTLPGYSGYTPIGCITCTNTKDLDCEKIRLAPLVTTPCIKLSKAENGGLLRNGSYQVFAAYTINQQKITDYIGISNVQSLFDHNGTAGSLNITLSNFDTQFEYFELVILSNNQQNTVAKKIGYYSTQEKSINIDYIDQALETIPVELLTIVNPAYEKSDSMYVVNDWLIRSGPYEQFDFNYQPIANQIQAKWVVAEYPSSYYHKGGNKTGFMRDEQYPFFIRWIYNTGEKSSSYHIPCRPPRNFILPDGSSKFETDVLLGTNVINPGEKVFQVYNTAGSDAFFSPIPIGDGGSIIARGEMAYWESTEKYPSKRPDIWNSTYVDPITGVNIGDTLNTQYDLCGKNIRHHKFPTEELDPKLNISTSDDKSIRILGVEFGNIGLPKDNDGNVLTNIVGYELLRGSREGNKSILAKGIFRNMRRYNIPEKENLLGGTLIGLYPNYPYNDLREDAYFHDGTSGKRTDGSENYTTSITHYPPLKQYVKDVFTFHSPELMFKKPYLNAYETRIYGTLHGQMSGNFIKSEHHPQNKLLRNSSLIVSSIFGIGYALEKIRGKKKKVYDPVQYLNVGYNSAMIAGNQVGNAPIFGPTQPYTLAAYGGPGTAIDIAIQTFLNDLLLGTIGLADIGVGNSLASSLATSGLYGGTDFTKIQIPGTMGGGSHLEVDGSALQQTPKLFSMLTTTSNFLQQFAIGTNEIMELMYNLVSYQDFAFKLNSSGFYNNFDKTKGVIFRAKNIDSNYIGSSFQSFATSFGQSYKINNLFRPNTVAVKTNNPFDNPTVGDTSRYTIGDLGQFNLNIWKDPSVPEKRFISALYGALKFNFDNQYGQLGGVKQLLMKGCIELIDLTIPKKKFASKPLFSGDTYIGKYTEKTIMPIFTDFLNGQPDQYPFDYLKYVNIPYPRYWMDTRKYDVSKLASAATTLNSTNLQNSLPNDLFYLDRPSSSTGINAWNIAGENSIVPLFAMDYAYMYTHVNGIQNFYVESEINLAQRDWEDEPRYRIYNDSFNNVNDLFHADIIKLDNYYKYDYSLSVSRFLTSLGTFGQIQPLYYDPKNAEGYYPKRLIYSLQAQNESLKDFWRVFLPNNYKDFKNKVNVIKPINKSGAMIFFPYQSPQQFQGLDQLETDLGTKLTIGDGGLFSQPFQNVVNSDLPNEYASCEDSRSVINTPYGVFFISQAQGKIFNYAGELKSISDDGMKWWFNKYLPSILLSQYPNLEDSPIYNNPVVGIGCQSVYDANDGIVYFMKKDYKVNDQYVNDVIFDVTTNDFYYKSSIGYLQKIVLGDPFYFENCSWTVSYDPKSQAWISFHDWQPELCMTSTNHFLTTKTEPALGPHCPPNYTYNSILKRCVYLLNQTKKATVTIQNIASYTTTDPTPCLMDIVVVMDTSTTNSPSSPEGIAQINFCIQLVNSFAPGAISNDIQMNFVSFSEIGMVQSLNPGGFSMGNYGNPMSAAAAIQSFYNANWYGSGFGLDIQSGMSEGNTILNNKAGSQRGDRSSDPNFKQILIVISGTDGTNNVGTINGCVYQSSTLGGSATSYQYLMSVYCGLTNSIPSNPSVFSDITCNYAAYQFGVNASVANSPANTALAVANNTCTPNITCNCPTGYTMVYFDPVSNTYSSNVGLCDPITHPPICRTITCDCPNPVGGGSISGVCDDVYAVGIPGYVNPNPMICNYYQEYTTIPSYEKSGIWRHNYRCDLFANYYGISYPWEVEFIENTGQTVNTIRSLEYQLESYVYKGNLIHGCGDDRWHDLDFNFDESIIYNSEQVSGLLKLELQPKNDPYGIIDYPIIGPSSIRIAYSKEEQKYRFNQFWDITNDRGEFSNAEQNIFITRLNGYIRDLNANNLNYQKTATQHKKFRHYYNKFILRRTNSENRKMLLKLNNTKLNISFR